MMGAEVVANIGARPGCEWTVDPVSDETFWKLCWNDAWNMDDPFMTFDSARGRSRAFANADTCGALDSVFTTVSTKANGLSDAIWNEWKYCQLDHHWSSFVIIIQF